MNNRRERKMRSERCDEKVKGKEKQNDEEKKERLC